MKSLNGNLFLSWLVLLLTLLLTGFLGYRFKTNVERIAWQDFERRCDEIKLRIEARLAAHKQILLSSAALFDASHEVSRDEWKTYVNRLSLDKHFEGVQALGFSLWIPPEKLKAHEAKLHKSGFHDYVVKPEGVRETYTSIIYIEPFNVRNQRAFGFDMYSEPTRHLAMTLAMDNNDAYLSGKVRLLQETNVDVQAGTLMYVPVYQKNKPIETIEQRRAAIFGWIYSPFRMTNLLRNILFNSSDINVSGLRLKVYDGTEMQDANLLYQSDVDNNHQTFLFDLKIPIVLHGRDWTLHFEQYTGNGITVDYNKVWIVLGSGTIISFLLFFLLRSYLMVKIHATKMAFKLTEQLRESEKNLTRSNTDLLQFANIAAHHLQEPARRIVSFVYRLKNELSNLSNCNNEDAMVALQFIEQSAIRQRALVRDIQLYLAATQPRAAIESVPVVEILPNVLKNLDVLIQKTEAQVEWGELPSVLLDRPRIYDIFSILLQNSLNYRRLDTTLKIRIHGERRGQRTYYYFEDNGIGIPVEYRERVFLVFERLQVKDNQESTGIGLAIVKRILESCDGSVILQETTGGGTTVILDLPSGN